MRLPLTLVAAGLALLAPALSYAAFGSPERGHERAGEVAIFYYSWFGTPARNGDWLHWNQYGASRRSALPSSFYPARGPYSSADAGVVAAQMAEIATAGVDTLVVSWWGLGSDTDERLREVAAAAAKQNLRVAVHLEPYGDRTAESVGRDLEYLRELGVRDVYVYDSTSIPDSDWAALDAARFGVRLFANTRLAGKAKAGRFAGLYTYDVLLYNGNLFERMCAQAHKLDLLCAPSVGPGYDAGNATPDARVRHRRAGATYDGMWRGAIRARADIVTITSYNEWHEGTQIEPRALPAATAATTAPGASPGWRRRRPTSTARRSGPRSTGARVSARSCPDDDVRAAAGDQRVVDVRLRDTRERDVPEVDLDVGPALEPERARALVGAEAEQTLGAEHAAPACLAARDALELAQLLERVDAHVRVRADAERHDDARVGRPAGSRRRDPPRSSGRRRPSPRSRPGDRAPRRRRESRARPSSRGPRQPVSASSSIGRRPCSARHSSISRGCSSACTCSGSSCSAA